MPILIGTSGYSYPDWVGHVYPPGTSEKDFLQHYCHLFPLTELNFSYYHQPEQRTLARMVHVTPDTFRFAIKGYKGLTHELSAGLQSEARVFKDGIAPLVEAGRLASVVMQFPYSFHYTTQSRKYLDSLCREFEGYPTAVEFRNSEWQRDSVYKGLQSRHVALVNVDEPLLPGLPRPTAIVTAPHAYVRFHGRNAANWWNGDNTTRYDYSYNGDELSEWIPRVRQMAGKAANVMVLFNNHFQGKAVEDARKLKAMLEEAE
jgi:uncharacterized protein YecE (DUF72 family)